MDNLELTKVLDRKVVKSNALIQRSRHQFSLQQQKALFFLISQLKPDQLEFEWQSFDITQFREVCDINDSGKNYKDIKDALKGLSDKSMWVEFDDDNHSLLRWVEKIRIKPLSGEILVRFDEDMKPFLLDLKTRYTQFELRYTLAMKSKYSIRLYELLKSYVATNEVIHFELPRFKKLMGVDYDLWYDIKRKVIDISVKEINEVSDLQVSYQANKKGRSFVSVDFWATIKGSASDSR